MVCRMAPVPNDAKGINAVCFLGFNSPESTLHISKGLPVKNRRYDGRIGAPSPTSSVAVGYPCPFPKSISYETGRVWAQNNLPVRSEEGMGNAREEKGTGRVVSTRSTVVVSSDCGSSPSLLPC